MSKPRPSLCAATRLRAPTPPAPRYTSTIDQPQGLFRVAPE